MKSGCSEIKRSATSFITQLHFFGSKQILKPKKRRLKARCVASAVLCLLWSHRVLFRSKEIRSGEDLGCCESIPPAAEIEFWQLQTEKVAGHPRAPSPGATARRRPRTASRKWGEAPPACRNSRTGPGRRRKGRGIMQAPGLAMRLQTGRRAGA